jgi:hypothetical protein
VPDSPLEQLIAELQTDDAGSLADSVKQAVEHSRLDPAGVDVEADERTLLHSDASSRSRPAVALLAPATRA